MSSVKTIDLGLKGYDELFMTGKERLENNLPKIYDIPLSEIDDFPDHPYKVKLDEDMDQLVQSIKERGVLTAIRYAYRVLFVPINAKRQGQADQVVEFIKSDSPLAEGLEKTYAVIKETEKKKYLPGEIVRLMKNKGYDKFSINKHTELWKSHDAKNPKFSYGVSIANTWYWYETWVHKVEENCEAHKNELKSQG